VIQGVKGEVKNNTRYSLSFESYLSRQGNRLDTPEYGKPNAQRVNTTPSLPSFIANASSLNSEFKFVSSGCRKDVPGSWISSIFRTSQSNKSLNLLPYPSLFRHLERKYKR